MLSQSEGFFATVHLFIVTITPDCMWSLSIGGSSVIPQHCVQIKDIPDTVNGIDSVLRFLECLDKIAVCIGNPDAKFMATKNTHKGVFKSKTGIRIYA